MAKLGDDEFMFWATKLKKCRYCPRSFYGPVCECEKALWSKKSKD